MFFVLSPRGCRNISCPVLWGLCWAGCRHLSPERTHGILFGRGHGVSGAVMEGTEGKHCLPTARSCEQQAGHVERGVGETCPGQLGWSFGDDRVPMAGPEVTLHALGMQQERGEEQSGVRLCG